MDSDFVEAAPQPRSTASISTVVSPQSFVEALVSGGFFVEAPGYPGQVFVDEAEHVAGALAANHAAKTTATTAQLHCSASLHKPSSAAFGQ
jgi:hypothetical protein